MRPTSRALVLAALLVAACTADEEAPPEGPSRTPADDGLVSRDPGATTFAPGRFIYQFNSITAQVTFEGSTATMNVRNASGAPLGAPSLAVISGAHRRYEGVADTTGPVADGGHIDLRFTFDDAVRPETIGLAVLSFGADNVGAMAPVPVGGA